MSASSAGGDLVVGGTDSILRQAPRSRRVLAGHQIEPEPPSRRWHGDGF